MIKRFIKAYLVCAVITYIVVYGWQLLEYIMLGKLEPSVPDSIIGIILILSLNWNYLIMRDIKKLRNMRGEFKNG